MATKGFDRTINPGPRRQLVHLAGLVLLALGLLISPVAAQDSNVVYVMTFDGPVNPVLVSYMERGIEQATARNAQAIVLRLDTPGGQVDLTQDIVKLMRAAPVPIIVYVWPTGAMAGSAGTFITLAGHAAAMTPGSSIGAASPVSGGGEEPGRNLAAEGHQHPGGRHRKPGRPTWRRSGRVGQDGSDRGQGRHGRAGAGVERDRRHRHRCS